MTEVTTLGIDEAGRGPILGPLVMAAVVVRTAAARALTRAGVTDSKAFGAGDEAHARRLELAARVRELADHVGVRVITVDEIDRRVHLGQLNHLEREHALALITQAPPVKRIVCDGARMFAPLSAVHPHLEAHDRGESVHVAVAAASIVAKAERDEQFRAIAARYAPQFGPIAGGGYDNAATRRFLEAFVSTHGCLPPEARRSWGGATARLQLRLL
jgi:ribonuclease HII